MTALIEYIVTVVLEQLQWHKWPAGVFYTSFNTKGITTIVNHTNINNVHCAYLQLRMNLIDVYALSAYISALGSFLMSSDEYIANGKELIYKCHTHLVLTGKYIGITLSLLCKSKFVMTALLEYM